MFLCSQCKQLSQRKRWSPQPPGQDQQNGKQKQCPLPPWLLRTNLKDTSSHISKNSLGLYFSAEYLLNALSELYIPPNFQIYGAQIRGNTFASQNIESIFTHAPRTPSPPPVSYHYTPEREKSPIPPDSKIYSVPAEMGGRENCLMKPSNDNSKEEYKFRIIHDLLLSF